MHLWNPRAEPRYIRFSVRWTEPSPRQREAERAAIRELTATTAITEIAVDVVRERPLAPATMPLVLPGCDRWF